jgi:hypothetical protein
MATVVRQPIPQPNQKSRPVTRKPKLYVVQIARSGRLRRPSLPAASPWGNELALSS